jgi:uncharacterized protein (DUF2384 family)
MVCVRAWSPLVVDLKPPKHPDALSDVRPLLNRTVKAFGAAAVARMLDVNRAMITRWRDGAPISVELSRRISDLHDVLGRALRIMHPRTAMDWLVGSNQHLGGARPIDVLALRGAGPVIEALRAFEDLGYA